MSIEVSTTPGAEVTWIKHTRGTRTQEMTGLSLTDVRQLINDLTEVVELAPQKPARRRLGQPGERGA